MEPYKYFGQDDVCAFDSLAVFDGEVQFIQYFLDM